MKQCYTECLDCQRSCKLQLLHLNSNNDDLQELEEHLPRQVLPGLELAPRVHEKELDSAAYLVHLVRRAGSASICCAPVPPSLPAVADATISRSRVGGGARLGGEDSVRVRVIATFLKVAMVRQGSVVDAVAGINGVHIGHVLQL